MVAPYILNEKVSVERRSTVRDPDYGTESEVWTVVADHIWANVQDVLPSRAEVTGNAIRTGARQSRIRMRKRDIQLTDRVRLHGRGDAVVQVISGPALLDDRLFIELMTEGFIP